MEIVDFKGIDGIATWVKGVSCIHFKRGLVLHKLTMDNAKMDGVLLNFQETLYALLRSKMVLLLSSSDTKEVIQVTLEDLVSSATILELIRAHTYLHFMQMGKGPLVRLEPLSIDEKIASKVISRDLNASEVQKLQCKSPVPPCQLLECFRALLTTCNVKIPPQLVFDTHEPIYRVKGCPVWASVPDGECLDLFVKLPTATTRVTVPPAKWLVAVSNLSTVYVLELQDFSFATP